MAFRFLTVLFTLQITFYYTEAMPTVGGIEMPVECRNQTFCTSDNDYPQEAVDLLLKDQDILSFRIGFNLSPQIENRQWASDSKEISPCEAVSDWKRIHYIIDEKDNVRVVAQSMQRFNQDVPIIKCKSQKPTNASNKVKTDLGKSYYTVIKCTEDKLNFTFVVLSPDLSSLELARAKDGVPVGCQCRYVE